MTFEPTALPLETLFTDPSMFDSRKAWRRAGFDVFDPSKDTEVMVAAHPSAPGYLFKKYTDDVSTTEQRNNYAARIEGAGRLRRFIEREQLANIVVPHKYLHELPKEIFGKKSLLLVVERLNLVGRDASEDRYKNITEPVLRELLRVIVKFRGLDSNSKNIQFTEGGKIAFIDLENWDQADRKATWLKSIGTYLSKDRRTLATKILAELK
ncbi:MAG TPA: hypothetical protein VLE97_07240 [Gaiellaceae bacterium]|nr:hypothetical protein [Gaiellaceae bacterium]